MDISIAERGRVTIVVVEGSVDTMTSDTLAGTLKEQISRGHPLLVADFSQVTYISSSGLRTVLGTMKESREQGGDFILAGPNENIMKILEMSGVSNLIKVYPDVDQALSSLA